jgi:hypothetical protein
MFCAALLQYIKTHHDIEVREERRDYDEARRQSGLNPFNTLTISMDTMDNAKTQLPHPSLYRETKELDSMVLVSSASLEKYV